MIPICCQLLVDRQHDLDINVKTMWGTTNNQSFQAILYFAFSDQYFSKILQPISVSERSPQDIWPFGKIDQKAEETWHDQDEDKCIRKDKDMQIMHFLKWLQKLKVISQIMDHPFYISILSLLLESSESFLSDISLWIGPWNIFVPIHKMSF